MDGSIFDANGVPVSSSKDIQIKAYDSASGGTLLWTSAITNTSVSAGRFTINLDAASGSSPSLVTEIGLRTSGQGVYFQIEVDSGAADGVMDSAQIVLPRIRAKGTMFALAAAQADSISGVTATTAEMNRLAGVTANIQTQINSIVSSDPSSKVSKGGDSMSGALEVGSDVTTTGTMSAQDVQVNSATGSRFAMLDSSKKLVSSANTVSDTEFSRLVGVTASLQAQLNAKAGSSHTHAAGDVTSGQLALSQGGTGADLSATGGTGQYLKQASSGATVTVGAIAASDLPTGIDASKITVGSVTTAVLGGGTANNGTFLRGDGTWAALPGVPAGSIQAWGGTSAPTGWLLCDGSAVSRTTYADLFAAIGTAFGSGNGSTTFNLPDFRGRFLRGVDGSAGRDPDDSSRTAMNTGGNAGDSVGSVQEDAFQGHRHNGVMVNSGPSWQTGGGGFYMAYGNTGSPVTDGTHGTPRTTSETRPINANVNYIIKHTPAASSGTVTSADLTAFFAGVTANVQTQLNASLPRGHIGGAAPVYVSTSSISIANGLFRNSANDGNIDVPSGVTVSINSTGLNGLDAGTKAASTWYYLYAVTDGSSSGYLLSTVNEVASGSVSSANFAYTKKRQLPYAIATDSSSNLLYQFVGDGWPTKPRILYNQMYGVVSLGTATTKTAVSAATWVPGISQIGTFWNTTNAVGTGTCYAYPSGLAGSTWIAGLSSGSLIFTNTLDIPLDASRNVYYSTTSASIPCTFRLTGYIITEVP